MTRVTNDIPRWLLILAWLVGNIAMFVYAYLKYDKASEFYYLRVLIGGSLPVARGSAACLNLNCMLVLVPVCRNFMSFLRGSMKRCCTKTVRRQLDKHITFHQYIAYMICLHTAIHIGAHVFNVERFFQAHSSTDKEVHGLRSALSNLGDSGPHQTYINPVRSPSQDPTLFLFSSVAGLSGVVATIGLILIVTSSTETIRRSYFEVFWFSHHLFIPFYIGICVHGLQGIVHHQTNLDEHDPEVCRDKSTEWGKIPECPIPQFSGGSPKTWQWVIGPMVLYFLERLVRFVRSKQKVVITKVVKHPSKVYELQMKKSGFSMDAGQYISVQCPSVSYLEWHPFTLTSAPEDDHFSIHIRIVGDWTSHLAKACHVDELEFKENIELPEIAVDGPFGTATEDIFSYEVDIFVAAGIGVTPFASVLKHICYQADERNKASTTRTELRLKKVYFFWICPDTCAFEWLHDLLKFYDHHMEELGNANFLSYFIYLTRGWDLTMAKAIVNHDEDVYDVVTGLHQKTHYGRPNWNVILPDIATNHPGTKVGVFFCGPKGLSTVLHKACNQHSTSDTKFYYNKENF